jgi:hypothetical protein
MSLGPKRKRPPQGVPINRSLGAENRTTTIMKLEEARALFILAGFEVLKARPLPDGYGYPVEDPRYLETTPRQVWWFIKTKYGWIEIGWRKRVISIFWEDCGGPHFVTQDNVTKNGVLVHAWTTAKAVEYLTNLRLSLERVNAAHPERDPEALVRDLATCYRLSGADPDGKEDWRLARGAVREVQRMCAELDALERAELDALESNVSKRGLA